MKKYWILPGRGSYSTFKPSDTGPFGDVGKDAIEVVSLEAGEVVVDRASIEKAFYKIIEDRTNTMERNGIPHTASLYSAERMRDCEELIKILFKTRK